MRPVVQYTGSGEAHGLINVLTNSVPFDDFKHMEPKVKAQVEKDKKDDSRMVKVELMAKHAHERLEKVYMRYSGDPILCYKLIPGRQYEVPMGFVKEVNEKKRIRREGLLEEDGKAVTKSGAPLEKDVEGDWQFRLVPINF